MRTLGLATAAGAALLCSGCLQWNTLVRINGDGSGTIEHKIQITTTALAQLRQLAALGNSDAAADPLSEERIRLAAGNMGPGVSFLSSTVTRTETGEGRDVIYGFSDINQLRIDARALQAGGSNALAPGNDSVQGTAMRFAFTRGPDGNALVRIAMPVPTVPGLIGARGTGQRAMSPERLATMKQMFAGMRLAFVVEPIGRVISTTSPFVEGRQVTLVDLDYDRLLQDDRTIAHLQAPQTLEEIKAVLKDVPGAKICLDREITIEFAPDKTF